MTHDKPELLPWIKAEPADNFDALKKQFQSLKSMVNSMGEQLSYYQKKSYETGEKHLAYLSEQLESEKAMNAKLTEELDRAHAVMNDAETPKAFGRITKHVVEYVNDGDWPNGTVDQIDADLATIRAALSSTRDGDEHCKDCCCARSWKALGIAEYTGKSIPEHIADKNAQIDRMREPTKEMQDAIWLAAQLQNANNQYRAMIAAAPEAESRWQPIETAPMDGSQFLITDGECVCPAEWTGDDWHIFDTTCHMVFQTTENITHWMPLPEPPMQGGEDDNAGI